MKFEDSVKEKHNNEIEERLRVEEERVRSGQELVNKHVNMLRNFIAGSGKRNSDGKISILYGELFRVVENKLPTLSGTLKTARRLHIVDYEGETLFQGASDNVEITLLDERRETVKYEIVVREKGNVGEGEERDPFKLDALKDERCHVCDGEIKTNTERIGVAEKTLHKKCFRCFVCHAPLTVSRYGSNIVENDLRFYCLTHYKQLFLSHADYLRFDK